MVMGNTDFSKNSSEIALLIIIIIFTTYQTKLHSQWGQTKACCMYSLIVKGYLELMKHLGLFAFLLSFVRYILIFQNQCVLKPGSELRS